MYLFFYPFFLRPSPTWLPAIPSRCCWALSSPCYLCCLDSARGWAATPPPGGSQESRAPPALPGSEAVSVPEPPAPTSAVTPVGVRDEHTGGVWPENPGGDTPSEPHFLICEMRVFKTSLHGARVC